MPRARRASNTEPKPTETARPRRRSSTTRAKRDRSPDAAPTTKRARVEKPAAKASLKKTASISNMAEEKKAKAVAEDKPKSKPAPKPLKKEASTASIKEAKPDLIPLPTLPPATRPAALVFTWGASDSGQLGYGPNFFHEISKPRRFAWAEEQTKEGTFGSEPGAGIVSVTSGGLHTFLLDETGKVWSAGTNDEGALGRVTKKEPTPEEKTLTAQLFFPIQTLVDEEYKVVQIATGDNFGAALNDQGILKVWGTFRDDEGHSTFSGSTAKQMHPMTISINGQTAPRSKFDSIASIASGENHLVALTTRGEVYSWGIGGSGQLGRRVLDRHRKDALMPQRVVLGKRSRKAVVIGGGLRASFAVDEAGEVWGWGINSVGQLGIGETGDAQSSPVNLEDLSPENLPKASDGTEDRVVQIEGGEFHTVFLTKLGKVYACGACNDYQLGLPDDHEAFDGKGTKDAQCVPTPTLVPFPDSVEEDDQVSAVSCGPRYSFAVTKQGMLLSWGVGLQSELGLGEDNDSAITPTVVVRREGKWATKQVSCGGQHVAALLQKKEDS